MADRYPLVVASGTVQEIASGDNLNLDNNGIEGVNYIGVNSTSVAIGSSNSSAQNIPYLVAIGSSAAANIGVGASESVIIGTEAGIGATASAWNIMIGTRAGAAASFPTYDNAFLGRDAGRNSSGSCNFFAGVSAGQNNAGTYNVAIGYLSGQNTKTSGNVFIGQNAGTAQCGAGASSNVFIGQQAGCANTNGACNVFLGFQAGCSNTTGGLNVFIGERAGFTNTSASGNTFIGEFAGAGISTSGDNTAFGRCSLGGNGDATGQHSGPGNIAIGPSALRFMNKFEACYNIGIGLFAGACLHGGKYNTYIGHNSGFRGIGIGTHGGSNNTGIGYRAGAPVSTTPGDFGGLVSFASTDNAVVLGNYDNTLLAAKVNLTVISDIRDKKVLGEVPLGLNFVQGLEPIKFQFADRNTGEVSDAKLRYGFSAQQIAELEGSPEVIADLSDPESLKVNDSALIPVLVNAIKELSAKVDELQARLDAQ